MKNTFGNAVSVTLFGESHGPSIGVVLDGLPAGLPVEQAFIRRQLELRRPAGDSATARHEQDAFVIESGVFNGKTTGTPLCIRIPNMDTRSEDYTRGAARPSHADYTAACKYHGFEDYRGGGHFSGRLTAALVAAGAVVLPALARKGIHIGTHIQRIADVEDAPFTAETQVLAMADKSFAVVDDAVAKQMTDAMCAAKAANDSVGGVLETAVLGMPVGVGEPWFDTVEGVLSHAIFSIPAVKGIEFGLGFGFAALCGSQANDALYAEGDKVFTYTNNNGGVNGGITNGMPLTFRIVVKPTPTIGVEQRTVDLNTMQNTTLCAAGRHDACIVPRARVVVDSVTALAVADLLATRFGTDWMGA